jgi:hypothetical protein
MHRSEATSSATKADYDRKRVAPAVKIYRSRDCLLENNFA